MGADFYIYPDGLILPAIRGGQEIPPPPVFGEAEEEEGQEEKPPQTLLPGMLIRDIVSNDVYTITSIKDGRAFVSGGTPHPSNPNGEMPLPGGSYASPSGFGFDIGNGGIIRKDRSLRKDEYDRIFPELADGPGGGDGADGADGGGGGGGSATSILPDYAGAATLLLNHYDLQLDQGRLTLQEAKDQYARAFEFFSTNSNIAASNRDAVLTAAIENARLQSDNVTQQISAATNEEQARREREIAESNRQLTLQDIATERAGIAARDILPASIPGLSGISMPGVNVNGQPGPIPVNQVDLGQFFSQGLPGLSNLPAISPNPSVPFPTIGPAPQVQQPEPVPLMQQGQFPTIPGLQLPQIPNIDPFVQGLLNPQPIYI